jgi:hypothetical protein
MSEIIAINDVTLKVNPTDINVIVNRFVEEMDLVRESSPFSFSSPHGYTSFTLTLAFDIANKSSVYDLVKISTQLDKFPFLWIKSNRLISNILGNAKAVNGFAMYAVESWTMKCDSKSQGIVYLAINGYYFNHLPLVEDFNFISYVDNEKNEDKFGNLKNGAKLITNTTFNPADSRVFEDFFSKETELRNKIVDKLLGHGSLAHLSFSIPTMYPSKIAGETALKNNRSMRLLDIDQDPYSLELTPINKKRYDGMAYIDEDGEVSRRSYDQYKTDLNSETMEVERMFLAYLESPLVNQNGLVVQEISVTKKNKLAINKMQGYMEPIIQYMGKAPAQLNMTFAVNSAHAYSDIGQTLANNMNPSLMLNAILANVDSQVLYNQRMSPFKNVKVNNFLTYLAGAKYFILDNKIYTASAQEQGRDMLYLNMTESDLTTLSNKLKARPIRLSWIETSKMVMINIILDALNVYMKSADYKNFSTNLGDILANIGTRAATEFRDNINKKADGPLQAIGVAANTVAETVGTIASDLVYGVFPEAASFLLPDSLENSEFNIDGMIAGHEYRLDSQLAKSLYRLNAQLINYSPFFNPKGKNPKLDRKSVFNLNHLVNHLNIISRSLKDDSFEFDIREGSNKEVVQRNVFSSIRGCFEAVIYLSQEGDKFAAASAKRFIEEMQTKGADVISRIEGEAIPDLKIGESLGENYLGGTDPQKLDPFFFIDQTVYVDAKTIKAQYDIVNNKYKDQFDLINSGGIQLSENYIDTLNDVSTKLNGELTQTPKVNLSTSPIDLNIGKDMYNVIPIIESVAEKYGLDKRMMVKIAHLESTLNPNSRYYNKEKKKFSDFRGLFQVSGDILKRHMNISDSSDEWKDPRKNSEAAMLFITKEVIPALTKNNIPISTETLYLSFQQGPAGFRRIYKAHVEGMSAESFADEHPVIASNMRANNPYGGTKKQMASTLISPTEFLTGWHNRIAGRKNAVPTSSVERKEAAQNRGLDNKRSATENVRSTEETRKNETVKDTSAAMAQSATVKKQQQMNQGEMTEIQEDVKSFENANAIESGNAKVFEGMEISAIDIFKEQHQAQYRALRTGKYFEYGLNISIPTVKIYIVEGNENDFSQNIKQRKRNLIEIFGFSDIKVITPSEEDPVGLAYFNVVNPLSSYSDVEAMAQDFAFKIDYSKISSNNPGEELRIKAKSLRLIPGLNILIKMGYGNNPNDLETVFAGVVTEADGEEMISIVAEGHGREMVMVRHSLEKVEKASGTINSSTSGIINEVMLYPEILNFGERNNVINSNNPYARNILSGAESPTDGFFSRIGKWTRSAERDGLLPLTWTARSELFTNVFSPSIEDKDDTYTFGLLKGLAGTFSWNWNSYSKQYPLYNTTPWEVLDEMQFRHPGTRSQVLNYENRSTFFFGIKEQLYYAESPMLSTIKFATDKAKSAYSPSTEAEAERYLNLKPVADFHLLTSEHNIISNELSLNNKFGTQVNVRWFSDLPSREDFETNAGKFEYYQMQLDDNLLPRSIRSITLDAAGCDHQVIAAKYGQVALRKEVEKMYDGKIFVIGNPYIKAGDFAYLNDRTRGLIGIIKVRECIHHFNTDRGFVTEITPGTYAEESSLMYSTLIPKLGLTFGELSTKMISNVYESSLSRNNELFILSAIALDGLLINAQARKDYGPYIYGASTGLLMYGTNLLMLQYATSALGGSAITGYTATALKAIVEVGQGAISGTKAGIDAAKAKAAANAAQAALNNGTKAGRLANITMNIAPRLGAVGVRLSSLIGIAGHAGRGIVVAAVANPVGIAIAGLFTMAVQSVFNTIEEIELTRQPVRIYPLACNGSPYVVGLDGFEYNTWSESKLLEIQKTWDSLGKIKKNTEGLIYGDGGLTNTIINQISESRSMMERMQGTSSPIVRYSEEELATPRPQIRNSIPVQAPSPAPTTRSMIPIESPVVSASPPISTETNTPLYRPNISGESSFEYRQSFATIGIRG